MGRSWIDNLEEERDDYKEKCRILQEKLDKIVKITDEVMNFGSYVFYAENIRKVIEE